MRKTTNIEYEIYYFIPVCSMFIHTKHEKYAYKNFQGTVKRNGKVVFMIVSHEYYHPTGE